MSRKFLLGIGLGVGLLGAPAALAGGWAVTALDQVPVDAAAGIPCQVGFTVLQHGLTPADGLQTSLTIHAIGSERSLEFKAQGKGAPGHYVAEVRFPSPGEWTWEVNQGWFGPQELGSITVAAPTSVESTAPMAILDPQVAGAGVAGLGHQLRELRWALALGAAIALLAFLGAIRHLTITRTTPRDVG